MFQWTNKKKYENLVASIATMARMGRCSPPLNDSAVVDLIKEVNKQMKGNKGAGVAYVKDANQKTNAAVTIVRKKRIGDDEDDSYELDWSD